MKATAEIKPILSVVVPIYNAASTLERCLTSLLNQSCKSIEIICVDDCSTDNSEEILLRYQNTYRQKIVYAKTNTRCGPGGARNLGIKLSRGEYIGFVDGDDWIDSSLYSVVLDEILKHNADIAVFGVMDEFGSIISSRIRYQYSQPNSIDHTFALHLLARTYHNDIYISPMVCQKVYKSSFLQANRISFHSSSYYEDDLFSFRCFLHKGKTILVPGVFYHYYQRHDSITHTFSKKHIDDFIELVVDLKNSILAEGLWDSTHIDYYAFCGKCVRSTVNMLCIAEPSIQSQKHYISYLLTELQKQITIHEWIDYMDIYEIRRLFMN